MAITIERIANMHESQIEEFMNHIKHTFQPSVPAQAEIIRKAASLVRMNAIGAYRYTETEQSLMANISGTESEFARLSFMTMEPYCTCADGDWCAHQISVVFHLYSQFHSLSDWLNTWRQSGTVQTQLSINERTPEAWLNALSELVKPLGELNASDGPTGFLHYASKIEHQKTRLSPFEWEWKPLFSLYYQLTLLRAAWPFLKSELSANDSYHYGKWQLTIWLNEQMSEMKAGIKQLSSKSRLFETDAFHTKLKDLIHSFALDEDGLFSKRFEAFRLVYTELYSDEAELTQEIERLQKETAADAPLFRAFLYLTSGRFDELDEELNTLDATAVPQWLAFALYAKEDEDFDIVQSIMLQLLPHLAEHYQQLATRNRSAFAEDIDELLALSDVPEDQRDQLFQSYGPEASRAYGKFLFERNRYAEWAALMHLTRGSVDMIDSSAMKTALAEDSQAVFPLMHAEALKLVKEKNRDSYRRAVRLWKQMKAAAKRDGRDEFWNRYVHTVRQQFPRLRALMEEMEKGNLLL
ncbi:hypothetical protein CSV71_02065 [Sporosarcina sp. P21c]|uniref:hypothetical protein n=1 Tax=unclassified Sporosarcina TaxID=2647733 RepID=UPI000C171928|nr:MULTISPECIES: hypothetical protein [unclassified Sporosarcina]PIC67953.1 hypothetical protein CSV78_03950 [Sporosarcina sp. P16a]PIC82414.1 hypothetical protein CSV73_12895 [Sporosarcina sp. P1]PIC90865.1 hypothetical protein CSV71_02065 [Sporosarcina sp. P21c]PIC94262.1 hypothetical protein CSV70_00590 [Sporosarcina sp. P25]